MINGLIAMLGKVFGLFVDDGSLALSILVWIFALHVVMPIVPLDQGGAAPALFLGCVGILIENVLRASRQPVAPAEADKDTSAGKRSALDFSDSLLSQSVEVQTVSPRLRNEVVMNEPRTTDPRDNWYSTSCSTCRFINRSVMWRVVSCGRSWIS